MTLALNQMPFEERCVAKRCEGEWKGQDSKQEIERHTQGSEPAQQHKPSQNTAEAEAAMDHKPTGTE
jgi:hypothetical protein